MRLTADGSVSERRIEVRLDPRVEMSAEDARLQTESTFTCYRGYLEAQRIRDTIDKESGEAWMALRGEGEPGDPDTLYGSIREAAPGKETVVGLQEKFLYMMKLLQQADARPTEQALDAVKKLEASLGSIVRRFEELEK